MTLSFEDMELSVLRSAVDKIEKHKGRAAINDPSIKKMIKIVEEFIIDKKRICYGGTAINNILPKKDQFYDKTVELPDYDFFSPDPLNDAKELAIIFMKKGFTAIEAKAGVHYGTFKVYVNFIPIADITYLVPELYKSLLKNVIVKSKIMYCPPEYLRMSMYLELSRPDGDVSRWEKVLKRLTLLNKNYPLKGKKCNIEDIQRLFQYDSASKNMGKGKNKGKSKEKADTQLDKEIQKIETKIFNCCVDSLMKQKCVFFGAFANNLYNDKSKNNPFLTIPDFDVLSETPKDTAEKIKKDLQTIGIKKVKIVKKDGVGEIIAPHYEVFIGEETVVFIYEPLACHSYNTITFRGKKLRIATIDTMLSFYLAFIYVDRPYYDKNRILCMCELLFDMQQKNRLKQRGLLKRFSMNCYGKQETLATMRAEKNHKYIELRGNKKSLEYQWRFLNYNPTQSQCEKTSEKTSKKTLKKTIKKTKKGKKSTKKKKTVRIKKKKRK